MGLQRETKGQQQLDELQLAKDYEAKILKVALPEQVGS
jgi:hypothetical protein